MGFLSSISKAVSSVVKTVASIPSQVITVAKGGDIKTGTAAVAKPIINAAAVVAQSLIPTLPKPTVNTNIVKSPTVAKVLTTVVEHPYVSAAIVAAPITAIKNPAGAASVAKSLIPTSTAGKVAAVVAAPVVVGAVLQNPTGALNTAASAPSNLANFGANIEKVVQNPSLTTVKELVTENPLLSATIAAAAGVVLAKTATAVANIVTTERNTAALESAANAQLPSTPAVVPASLTQVAASPTPVTPATTPLLATAGANSSTKRKKAAKKAIMPSIRQNVNVIVQNRNQSLSISKRERIINKEILAY